MSWSRSEVVSGQPREDAERILRAFARRAFRRPTTETEIQPLLDRFREQLEQGASFERALRVGLKAVLVSPHFLFLREQVRLVASGETTRDPELSGVGRLMVSHRFPAAVLGEALAAAAGPEAVKVVVDHGDMCS